MLWILALSVVFALTIPRFIPIEKFISTPEINQKIFEKTGLNIKIHGKARISILPFVGIIAHNIDITNPSFQTEIQKVLSADTIEIKIAIIPLIFQKLVIKNITINQSTINLLKCHGKYNFFTPINSKEDIKVQQKKDSKWNKFLNKILKFKSFAVSNISITNSEISYQTCETDSQIHKITELNATISIPHFEGDIHAQISGKSHEHDFKINLKSSSLMELLNEGKGSLDLALESEIGTISAEGKYTINKKNPILLESVTLNVISKNITIKKAISPTDLSFNVNLEGKNLEIKDLSIKSPSFTLTGNGNFLFENGTIKGNSSLNIDDSKLNIITILHLFEKNKSINLEILADKINIDNYIGGKEPEKSQVATPLPIKVDTKTTQKTTNAPIKIWTLGKIPITSQISINEITFKGNKFERTTIAMQSQKNSIFTKINTNGFSGKVSIESTVKSNISGKNNILQSISTTIATNNTEMHEILQFFNQKQIIQGRFNSQITLSAIGSTFGELLTQNNGNSTFQSQNVTIYGFDADHFISDIKKDYKQILSGNITNKYISPEKKSNIGNVFGKFTIKNGTITNDKTVATKDEIQLTAFGTVNINNKNLDYTISASKGSHSLALPSLTLHGTTSNIKYSIDTQNYIKQNAKILLEREFNSPKTQEKLQKFEHLFSILKK